MLVANFTTKRILIDNDSSVDILFWDAFTQMGIEYDRLQPALMPSKGFTGDVVKPVGTITLSVLAGKAPKTTMMVVDFLVVNAPTSYNAILRQPTLNGLKAVMSTYHLKMKFMVTVGIGEVQGNQVLVHECYVQELMTG